MIQIFSAEELSILRQSPYVEQVLPKRIFYGAVFEREYHRLIQAGYSMEDSFDCLGLDPEILGLDRIKAYHRRYEHRFNDGLINIPVEAGKPVSISQELDAKNHQIQMLEQEVEFLKKKKDAAYTPIHTTEGPKQYYFRLIYETVSTPDSKLQVKVLTQLCGVSRSGYYNWIKHTRVNRMRREEQDRKDFDIILDVYKYKGYDKGYRVIHRMLLNRGILMNPKKILRLMQKYNIQAKIRRRRPQRIHMKETYQSKVMPNHVRREFRAYGPRKILLTDISYLPYGRDQIAYLSTIKDAYTNEIVAYSVSESLHIAFVLECIQQLEADYGIQQSTETIIHSDQGSHYTSIKFRELAKSYRYVLSMSRRGNCWDNTPQESFFGYMKDHLNLSVLDTFEQVKTAIAGIIHYYNNDRPQWNLAKLTPTQFYQYFITGVYPHRYLVTPPELPEVRKLELKI